jgi:hypothetical protein
MLRLYSFVNVGGNLDSILQNLEDVVIRVAVQTIECGIFIQQYTSNAGGQLYQLFCGVVLSMFDDRLPGPISTAGDLGDGESRIAPLRSLKATQGGA